MGILAVNISETDRVKVMNLLSGVKNGPQRVFVRSLNKTLTGVRTDASAQIRTELNATKKAVDATFKIQKATAGNMTAAISSTGKPLPLSEFTGTRQTKTGVSVLIKKGRKRETIPGTFIAKMKNGREGVFWRTWHGEKRKRGSMEKAINRQGYAWSSRSQRFIPMAALPKRYRLPITQRFSSSIPDVFGNEPIMKEVLAKANERLHTNLEHELRYELEKLK